MAVQLSTRTPANLQNAQGRTLAHAPARPAPKQISTSLLRNAAACLAAAAASLSLCTSSATAADVVETFANKCAGCHYQGGNVVAAGATLFTGDLQRNGVAEPDTLYNLIYAGKSKMPGFGKDCAPKGKCTFGPRLEDDEISALSQYVLERAAADWK